MGEGACTPGTSLPNSEVGRFDSLLGDVTLQAFPRAGALHIAATRTQTRTWLDRRAREWTQISTVFTAPPDAAFGVLYLRFNPAPDGLLGDDVPVRAAQRYRRYWTSVNVMTL